MAETVASIREKVEQGLAAYTGELRQAGPHWETKPAGSPEGEAAWNARQVAEHVAGAGTFFAAGVAGAVGAEGPERRQFQFASADEAIPATESSYEAFLGVVDKVTDAQLAVEFDHPRLGKQTVGGIIGIVAHHLNDHAGQLKTLRG
jgi:DinB superfamily